MVQEWYLKLPDSVDGPFTAGELRQQVGDGRLNPNVWVSGDRQQWVRASQLKGLMFQTLSPMPPQAQAAPADNGIPETGSRLDDTPSQRENVADKLLDAAQDTARKAKDSVQPEKIKAKVGSLVDAAKDVTAKGRDDVQSDEAKAMAEKGLGKAREALGHAEKLAAIAAHRAKDAAVATLPFWRKLLYEVREIGRATWQQTVRLTRYGRGIWKRRTLQQAERKSLQALGKKPSQPDLANRSCGTGSLRWTPRSRKLMLRRKARRCCGEIGALPSIYWPATYSGARLSQRVSHWRSKGWKPPKE
jgi:hypothetical protein